jgi:hypothetical protein
LLQQRRPQRRLSPSLQPLPVTATQSAESINAMQSNNQLNQFVFVVVVASDSNASDGCIDDR